LSRICFSRKGLVVPAPSPESGQARKTFFASESRRLLAPFYWDRPEEDVSEDVTVWLSATDEEVVDDETLPFA
jgi:hypothetical protein